MYCPKCKAEYREGISLCNSCSIALVDDLGQDILEYQELFPVYSPPDASLLAIAKSLLDGEGIKYWVQNELLQDLFGFGQMIGFNQIFGSPKIFVSHDDIEFCTELLKNLQIISDDSSNENNK